MVQLDNAEKIKEFIDKIDIDDMLNIRKVHKLFKYAPPIEWDIITESDIGTVL